jgi:hypothetical protein
MRVSAKGKRRVTAVRAGTKKKLRSREKLRSGKLRLSNAELDTG